MENNKEINEFISNKMSLDELNVKDPDLSLVAEARKKIAARKKKPANEIEDFFSLMAAFLNFKIKLYHAVIAAVITGGLILYTTREDHDNKDESRTSEYVSNIASVRSSTVLSSIYTFGLNKTQYDGRANN
ncbi:MAG: hypothetical protein V4635_12725 [Bacteroidota bacterium]